LNDDVLQCGGKAEGVRLLKNVHSCFFVQIWGNPGE
jgi:hypothetical protein